MHLTSNTIMYRCKSEARYLCEFKLQAKLSSTSDAVQLSSHGEHDHTDQSDYFLHAGLKARVEELIKSGIQGTQVRKMLVQEGFPQIARKKLTNLISRIRKRMVKEGPGTDIQRGPHEPIIPAFLANAEKPYVFVTTPYLIKITEKTTLLAADTTFKLVS